MSTGIENVTLVGIENVTRRGPPRGQRSTSTRGRPVDSPAGWMPADELSETAASCSILSLSARKSLRQFGAWQINLPFNPTKNSVNPLVAQWVSSPSPMREEELRELEGSAAASLPWVTPS